MSGSRAVKILTEVFSMDFDPGFVRMCGNCYQERKDRVEAAGRKLLVYKLSPEERERRLKCAGCTGPSLWMVREKRDNEK